MDELTTTSSKYKRSDAVTGVSVVVCCHNSAERLPQTLAHLAVQQVSENIPWEVLVIDNASTDETARVAQEAWPQGCPIPLRIIRELQLGLSYARHRGFNEAAYEFISFVDDDNWVCPNWVQLVFDTMSQHPRVGACGGFSEAECEVNPPWWFEHFAELYAVGPRNRKDAGDITQTYGLLWGAGLTVRKAAWLQLKGSGFKPLVADRQGKALTSGGDIELCLALRLAGWRLWYEPRLRLSHFLPAQRLNWGYLRRIYRGSGMSTVGHDPYYFAMKPGRTGLTKWLRKLRETWQWQAMSISQKLLRQSHKLLLISCRPKEGDVAVLKVESQIGRLLGLLRTRKTYSVWLREVRNKSWNEIERPDAVIREVNFSQ